MRVMIEMPGYSWQEQRRHAADNFLKTAKASDGRNVHQFAILDTVDRDIEDVLRIMAELWQSWEVRKAMGIFEEVVNEVDWVIRLEYE
jgi:hypothetical protein